MTLFEAVERLKKYRSLPFEDMVALEALLAFIKEKAVYSDMVKKWPK